MRHYSKEELLRISKEEGVSYIRLQFTDILGVIKAVEISAKQLPDALDNKIIFDGSSIEGFVRIKEADMFLYPDLDTWMILSFEDSNYGKVARLICDVYGSDGKPFEGDPRYILKKQVAKLHEIGISHFDVGFEPEFFLIKLDENERNTMKVADNAGYFDLCPLDGAEYIRRDIAIELEKIGFEIQTAHHEVAPGQEEINFRFADVIEACDNVQTFKQVVKFIARKHGYLATFMPKPFAGVNGSGMHTNCSLSNELGENLFYDPNDKMGLSLLCRKWISGIMNHARSLAALTNQSINSYKRLIPGYEAPCYICWSDANRSAMIRIPASRGKGTRTELRNVDATCNPYLALAAILACGIEGITTVKENELFPPVYDNIFELTKEERKAQNINNLPENLKEAVEELSRDELIKEVLGKHTYEKFVHAKQIEWDEYRVLITNWEIDKYINR